MTELVQAADELSRFGLLQALRDAGVAEPTRLNLTPLFKDANLDDESTYELWEACGRALGAIHRSAKWWIGDWLNFGEGAFGETFAQAVGGSEQDRYNGVSDVTGLAPGYLQNIARVSRQVTPSRRRADVSFSHHDEVAKLEPDAQKRYLARAAKEGLSQRELRQIIKAEIPSGKDAQPELGFDADEHDRAPADARQVLAVARLVWKTARRVDDGYLVPAEAWAQLTAAIGEER